MEQISSYLVGHQVGTDYNREGREGKECKVQGDPSGWLQPIIELDLGSSSYQLPHCPGKMAEQS